MCIAIYNHRHELSFETLRNSWDNNPQGGGLLFLNKKTNKLQTFKTYDFRQFYKAYLELLEVAKNETMILHFRIATQGEKTLDNLHPFLNEKENLGFVHNGIISQYSGWQHKLSKKSDTALFNEQVVNKLTEKFIYDQDQKRRMEKFVGRWNKLIFMNKFGDVSIVNEESGDWFNDQWFSNDSWCTLNKYHGHIKI